MNNKRKTALEISNEIGFEFHNYSREDYIGDLKKEIKRLTIENETLKKEVEAWRKDNQY